MAVRSSQVLVGGEAIIGVEKVASSGNYVEIGCATQFTYNNPGRTTKEINCFSGKKTIPTGSTPQITVDLEGVTHIYATGQQAANVSALTEVELWANDGTVKKVKVAGTKEGDPIFTGDAIFTNFKWTMPGSDESTYSVTITFQSGVTRTTVPTV